MTTVVYDGTILAADRYSSSTIHEETHFCISCKKPAVAVQKNTKLRLFPRQIPIREEVPFASSRFGSTVISNWLNDCVARGIDPSVNYRISEKFIDARKENGGILLVTDKQTHVITISGRGIGKVMGRYNVKSRSLDEAIFMGSGAAAAEIAMNLFGMNIFEAITFSSLCDRYSGGGIDYINCSQDLSIRSKKLEKYQSDDTAYIQKAVSDFKKMLARRKK